MKVYQAKKYQRKVRKKKLSKKYEINFIDNEHEDFYKEKLEVLQQYGKTDVYYRSLIYTLGICPTTNEVERFGKPT